MKNIPMEDLEIAIITKTGHGFELTDSFGDTIGVYQSWNEVAEMFRSNDFSEEYIAKRRADLERGFTAKIDETNE